MLHRLGWLSGLSIVFIVMLSFCNTAGAASMAFQRLIGYVEKSYLAPNKWQRDSTEQNTPDHIALMTGLVMGTQKRYVDLNPGLYPAFSQLEGEVKAYLDFVAQKAGNHLANGQYIDGQYLWGIAASAIMGKLDSVAIQEYHVDPSQVHVPVLIGPPPGQGPSIQAGNAGGDAGNGYSPSGKLRSESNSVNLLGEKASPDGRSAEEPNPRVFPPLSAVLGTWVTPGKYQHRLTVQQTGQNQAVGKIECAYPYRPPTNNPANKYDIYYKVAIENDNRRREIIQSYELIFMARTGTRGFWTPDYDVIIRRPGYNDIKAYANFKQNDPKAMFISNFYLSKDSGTFHSGSEKISDWHR